MVVREKEQAIENHHRQLFGGVSRKELQFVKSVVAVMINLSENAVQYFKATGHKIRYCFKKEVLSHCIWHTIT